MSIFGIYIVNEIYTSIIDIPPAKTDGLQIDNSTQNKCSMFNSIFVHRQQHHNLVNGPGICTFGGLDNHNWYYTIWANMNLSYSCQRLFRWNQIVFLHKYDVPNANISVSTMPFIVFPRATRYSMDHLFQKWRTRAWTKCQRLRIDREP